MALLVGSGTSLGGLSGGAATARLLVVISGTSVGLQAALGQATSSIAGFNQNAGTLGRAMTRSVTLPILGLSGAAIHMAMDFESAMARVEGLTPIVDTFKGGIEGLEDAILEMSTKVPTAPTELANALYFAGSAGLKAGQALEVVQLSAQASAIGMGTAADVAKVLIYSLNAFEGTGLTATAAMDSLTAAIREGTAEPGELAVALGRLLPIAKEAGIAFSEVVGSVASLTNIGVPTRVATTSLRALFSELLSPTERATDNLHKLGITADELRDALSAGPVVAFNLLQSATEGNIDALHTIIPQIRGFTAYLGLVGDRADEVQEVFDKTAHSAGYFGRAVEAISKTQAYQFGLALNDIRRAGISLGTALFPIFGRLFGFLSDIANAFSGLPGPMKTMVAATLALAAAAGPLFRLWGSLTNAGAGLFTSFGSWTSGILTMLAAVGLLTGGFQSLMNGTGSLISIVTTGVGAFVAFRLALGLLSKAYFAAAFANTSFVMAIRTVVLNANIVAAAIAALVVVVGTIIGSFNRADEVTKKFREGLVNLGTAGTLTASSLRQLADAADIGEQAADAMVKAAQAAGALNKPSTTAIPLLIEQMEGAIAAAQALEDQQSNDPLFELGLGQGDPNTVEDLTAALEALRQAKVDLGDITKSNITNFGDEQVAIRDLAARFGTDSVAMQDALSKSSVSAVDLTQSGEGAINMFGQMNGYIESTTGAAEGFEAALKNAEDQIRATRTEALQGNIMGNLFDPKGLEAGKKGVEKLLGAAAKTTSIAVDMAQNVQTLLQRGLDPAALQYLVDQGPGMVASFVGATSSQLKDLETAYAVSMGAIDATILNEGAHQEKKGNDMVAGFAEAIYRNRDLPEGAAEDIVKRITDAFNRGTINEDAIGFVTAITESLGKAKNVSGRMANDILNGITDAVIAGDLEGVGVEAIFNFVSGLAAGKGASASEAAGIASAVLNAMRSLPSSAYGIGFSALDNLKAGIIAATGGAVQAAANAAQLVKNELDARMHGSPKYFTYYLGENLMGQLGEGMNRRIPRVIARPTVDVRTDESDIGRNGGRDPYDRRTQHLTVEMDGRRVHRTMELRGREARLMLTGRRRRG